MVKSISEIYNKKYNAVKKIAGVKVKSRETNQRDKKKQGDMETDFHKD